MTQPALPFTDRMAARRDVLALLKLVACYLARGNRSAAERTRRIAEMKYREGK